MFERWCLLRVGFYCSMLLCSGMVWPDLLRQHGFLRVVALFEWRFLYGRHGRLYLFMRAWVLRTDMQSSVLLSLAVCERWYVYGVVDGVQLQLCSGLVWCELYAEFL